MNIRFVGIVDRVDGHRFIGFHFAALLHCCRSGFPPDLSAAVRLESLTYLVSWPVVNKKADVAEHPQVFHHVGLLANSPPAKPSCSSSSHPTTSTRLVGGAAHTFLAAPPIPYSTVRARGKQGMVLGPPYNLPRSAPKPGTPQKPAKSGGLPMWIPHYQWTANKVLKRPCSDGEKAMLPRTPDEMGMYLRKIARTPLLNRDDEAAIAEKVCRTRRTFLTRLLANDYSLRVVLAAARKAAAHKLRIDHVVDVQGIDAAARQAAYDRLQAGVKVLRRTLRKNRRDLRIAGDRQQPAEKRKDARQSLRAPPPCGRTSTSEAPVPWRPAEEALGPPSRIAVRMTDAVVQLKILDPTPANAARRREARGELRRLVRLAGESPQVAAAAAGRHSPAAPRTRGRLSRLHAAEPAAGGIDRKTICHDARRSAGPDPGGKSRPHVGGRQVRSRPGHRFSTYAYWWIRQTIRRALVQQRNGFRTSYVMTRKLDKIQHAKERHLQTRGAVPCTEDLADAVGIGAREMESLLRVQRPPLSIDESGLKTDRGRWPRLVADPRQECPSDRLDQSGLERRMDEILGNLDIRERQVLRMRYGLHGEQPLSLGDIGKLLRVTKERIRQIEESAMSKLRQPQHAARFVQFFRVARSVSCTRPPLSRNAQDPQPQGNSRNCL